MLMLIITVLISCSSNIGLKYKSIFEREYGHKSFDGSDTIDKLDEKLREMKAFTNGIKEEKYDGKINNSETLYYMLKALIDRDIKKLKTITENIDYRELTTIGGNDILCFAAYLGYKDETIYLLQNKNAQGEIKNPSEWNQRVKPIEFLIANRRNSSFADRKAILDKMIELNPNILNEINRCTGHNVLMYTTIEDDLEMFKYISKHPSFNTNINHYTREGMSILSYVGKYGSMKIYNYLFKIEDGDSGEVYDDSMGEVNINNQDDYDRTIFMMACSNGRVEMIKMLLDNKDLNIYLKDKKNGNLSNYVCIPGYHELLPELINKVYDQPNLTKKEHKSIDSRMEIMLYILESRKYKKEFIEKMSEIYNKRKMKEDEEYIDYRIYY